MSHLADGRIGDELNNKLKRDRVLMVAGVACLFSALWSTGFDAFFLFALCLVGIAGYVLGFLLLQNRNFCFCAQIVVAQFAGLIDGDDGLTRRMDANLRSGRASEGRSADDPRTDKTSTKKDTNYIPPPWELLCLNSRLNHELEELFETLMDNYVNNWYTEQISADASFMLEIRHLIRHSSAKLISRLAGIDLHAIFVDDLFPLLLAHVERICRISNTMFAAENAKEIGHAPPSFVEYKVLEQWGDDLHWAMRSSTNQNAYLRAVSDLLVRHLVDDIRIGGCFVDEEHMKILGTGGAIPSATNKWSCHGSRHFLREMLLSTILIPSIDFVSDPDSLNRLALSMLTDHNPPSMLISSPSEADDQDDPPELSRDTSPGEQFLAKFVESNYSHTPDSLLGLKLNDLVENPYLTRLFEMYLRDLNGPTHLLDCFVQARDIHMRIQALNCSTNDPNKLQQQPESCEICFDAWQLFSTFVHSNAPNRIALSEDIADEFSAVLENTQQKKNGKNTERDVSLKSLERVIEHVYQQVYQKLQYSYVIPFCQSENYLGSLCGAPPDVDELIRGPSDEQWTKRDRTKIPEGSFSLAQFRKKLFNFITATREAPSASSASSAFYPSSASTPAALDEYGTASVVDSSTSAAGGGVPIGGGDFETANFAMIDLSRDITKWSVAIEGVEQRRTAASQTSCYYTFSLLVERNDLPNECYAPSSLSVAEENTQSVDDYADEFDERLPRIWMVGHRYEEFYALEDRLREQHGGALRLSALPDRKTMTQLLQIGRNNNRTLMESHRVHFERFLQQLLQQPAMKRSDLLYAFLTSEENSTGLFELEGTTAGNGAANNFLPDLNPLRAMRKVGGKERGQNLKPFILNLLANTLAPPVRPQQKNSLQKQNSNSLSVLSESVLNNREGSVNSEAVCSKGGGGDSGKCKKQFSIHTTKIFPEKVLATFTIDEAEDLQQNSSATPLEDIGWKSNFYELFLFLVVHLGAITRLSAWIESLLCSLRSLAGFLFSLFARKRVKQALDAHLFNVEMVIYLVKSLHEFVLFWNVPASCCSLSATPSQLSMSSSAALQQQPRNNLGGGDKQRRKELLAKQHLSSAGIGTFAVSEQERNLRAELVLHCLEKSADHFLLPNSSPFLRWLLGRITAATDSKCPSNMPSVEEEDNDDAETVLNMESTVRLLFLCFQMPALNRQLALVLLDKLLQRVILEQPNEDGEQQNNAS